MTWDGVYQSVRCCEFSEEFTTPCQSLTVPQGQIGTRPMARRVAAAPRTSATQTSAGSNTGEGRAGAIGAASDPGIHPARIEDARRVEGALQARRDAHQRLGLR